MRKYAGNAGAVDFVLSLRELGREFEEELAAQMDGVLQDLRFAARSLRPSQGLAFVAVAMLAHTPAAARRGSSHEQLPLGLFLRQALNAHFL